MTREKIPCVQYLGINGSNKVRIDYQGMGIASQLCWPINSPRTFCWERRVFVCLALTIIQIIRETRAERSIPPSPPLVAHRVFSTHQSQANNCVAPKTEPANGWLCSLRSLPWQSGSQTIERSTTRIACLSLLNRHREPSRWTPKYLSLSRR